MSQTRDDLRKIVAKLKIMPCKELKKLSKNALLKCISDYNKYKELFPYEEDLFEDTVPYLACMLEKIDLNIKYDKKINKKLIKKIPEECCICLNKTRKIFKLPCCHKNFHFTCIIMWFSFSKNISLSCPMCRAQIEVYISSRLDIAFFYDNHKTEIKYEPILYYKLNKNNNNKIIEKQIFTIYKNTLKMILEGFV